MNGRRHPRFPHTVDTEARRKRRAREQRQSVWFGLGMFGLVGWSVAIPTLLGIAAGAWLDARSPSSTISWTLTGLAVGVATGCGIAWFWVAQETRDDPHSDPDPPSDPDPQEEA